MTWDSLVAHRRSVLSGYFLKKTLNKFKKKSDFGGFDLVGDGLVKHVGVFCPDYFSENCHMGSKSEKLGKRGNN